jgi:hypothetical protein
MSNVKSKSAVILACAISGLIFFAAILRIEAAPRGAGAAAQGEAANRIAVNSDDIGGVVTSANGPEAGVWVIAETTDLPTKFRKIVITDDAGRYLIPEMPKATYKVWVRGYGLVDSDPVTSTPGKTLALKAVVAPTPQAAAQYYPASYWVSLLNVPPKSAFPMIIPAPPPLEGDTGEGDEVKQTHISSTAHPPTTLQTQAEWLYDIKACYGCHQLGTKSTREIPASLGKFETSKDAWARFISSSQLGRGMMHGLNLLGHDQALEMFADWGDRIANGEVPPVPPRPQGTERNVVVIGMGLVGASLLPPRAHQHGQAESHGERKWPVYGADWSAGALAVIDPGHKFEENDRGSLPGHLRPHEARAVVAAISARSVGLLRR